jgi:hypothetical protein
LTVPAGRRWSAYREEQVYYIHQDKDQMANTGVMVRVAGRKQGDGNEVVCKHLPMIFSALLDVDN